MAKTDDQRRKKTILHVIDALNIGGAQELLVLLAAKTPRSMYQTLVCVLQPDLSVKSRLEEKGAIVYAFQRARPSIYHPLSFIMYFYRNIRELILVCRKHKVDVVHCHLSDAEFTGITAGWLYRAARVISTVHYPALLPERKAGDWRNYLRIGLTRFLYQLADAVIAVSEDTAEQLKAVFRVKPEKIRIVTNGIDVETIRSARRRPELLSSLQISPEQRIVTAVGRLMPPKGHRYLIEAMPHFASHSLKVKLLLVGDGELRESLTRQSQSLGVANIVSFLGSRHDVREILALTEVFVLPSTSEGTSLALLEAMAAGKPIVATDIPGNRPLLKHKDNCLLVPPGDPEQLAKAIEFLLKNPDIASNYGKKAYLDVSRQYSIEQTVNQLMDIWRAA